MLSEEALAALERAEKLQEDYIRAVQERMAMPSPSTLSGGRLRRRRPVLDPYAKPRLRPRFRRSRRHY